MGQSLFMKHSRFHNFEEIFCCGMTRLRNTNLDVYIQRQHTRSILESENMRHNLFKKYSKSQKFDEITRFRNVKLGVFRQSKHKNYFKKEKYVTELF